MAGRPARAARARTRRAHLPAALARRHHLSHRQLLLRLGRLPAVRHLGHPRPRQRRTPAVRMAHAAAGDVLGRRRGDLPRQHPVRLILPGYHPLDELLLPLRAGRERNPHTNRHRHRAGRVRPDRPGRVRLGAHSLQADSPGRPRADHAQPTALQEVLRHPHPGPRTHPPPPGQPGLRFTALPERAGRLPRARDTLRTRRRRPERRTARTGSQSGGPKQGQARQAREPHPGPDPAVRLGRAAHRRMCVVGDHIRQLLHRHLCGQFQDSHRTGHGALRALPVRVRRRLAVGRRQLRHAVGAVHRAAARAGRRGNRLRTGPLRHTHLLPRRTRLVPSPPAYHGLGLAIFHVFTRWIPGPGGSAGRDRGAADPGPGQKSEGRADPDARLYRTRGRRGGCRRRGATGRRNRPGSGTHTDRERPGRRGSRPSPPPSWGVVRSREKARI